MRLFVADGPQIVTCFFLAVTILLLERQRRLWLLPPLLLFGAKHGPEL